MRKLASTTTIALATAVALCIAAGIDAQAWFAKPPEVKVELRRAESDAADGLTEATIVGTNRKVYLHKKADATNDDIAEAKVVFIQDKYPAVEITFTKAGRKKMIALSKEHMDKPLAILVDGKVISAPTVKGKIADKAWIQGDFTVQEAEDIANGIKSK